MVARLFRNSDFLRQQGLKNTRYDGLVKGRTGICQKNRIELYNALIRPHLENSIQAWALQKIGELWEL